MTLVRAAQILIIVTLTWGTLAFGATYEWASRSMAVLAILASALCFAAGRRSPGLSKWLVGAMVLLLLAIGVQLVPLSHATLAELSPARDQLLGRMLLGYRFHPELRHPLSIDPPLTWWALVFFAVSCIWVAGVSNLLAVTGVKWLAKGLTFLGVAISVIGIIQTPLYAGRVYGFWKPEADFFIVPMGPFINKNHFAGWMLMVLPLTVAWFVLDARRLLTSVAPTWRDRLMWLTSEKASRLVLIAAAAGLMTMALTLTLSRSGILAMFVALFVSAGVLILRGGLRFGRIAAALTPLILAVVMIVLVVPEASDKMRTLGSLNRQDGRLGAWADALDISRHFPVAGTGLNTYGTATLFSPSRRPDIHFAQAHNDYLQLWVEGGVLLCLPAVLLSIALAVLIARRFCERTGAAWMRGAAVIGMVGILVQDAFDFSLQMPANFLLFATLCAIAIHSAPAMPVARPARHFSAEESRR